MPVEHQMSQGGPPHTPGRLDLGCCSVCYNGCWWVALRGARVFSRAGSSIRPTSAVIEDNGFGFIEHTACQVRDWLKAQRAAKVMQSNHFGVLQGFRERLSRVVMRVKL